MSSFLGPARVEGARAPRDLGSDAGHLGHAFRRQSRCGGCGRPPPVSRSPLSRILIGHAIGPLGLGARRRCTGSESGSSPSARGGTSCAMSNPPEPHPAAATEFACPANSRLRRHSMRSAGISCQVTRLGIARSSVAETARVASRAKGEEPIARARDAHVEQASFLGRSPPVPWQPCGAAAGPLRCR
jgi:hypothetical protein